MGLAASQGRYLCLTARNSDLIYEGQQISQQRLALASESQAISEKYNEAMNNTIMQATTPDGGTQRLTYDIITNQDPFSGLCMRIVDLDGNVVVPAQAYTIEAVSTNEDGESTTTSISSASSFISKYMSDLDGDSANEMSSWSLSDLVSYYQENYPDSGVTLTLKDNINYSLKNENEHFLYDENCTDPDYLQQMLTSGEWLLQQVSTENESGWEDTVWQGSTSISEVYDTSDDAAAEAEYEAALADIQKKDKILELRLEQVQTQQSSVETEIDSIKEVISKNIENSFKTFA